MAAAGPGQHARAGEWTCATAYPAPARSLMLGRQNLHLFRLKNTRFDVLGGIIYFFLVVSAGVFQVLVVGVRGRCFVVGRSNRHPCIG